jgi:hypothetical protein
LIMFVTLLHKKDVKSYADVGANRTLSLSYTLRQSFNTAHASGLERTAAPMYTQIVNEFLRTPVLTGSSYATTRTDGPILAWLEKTLREKRCLKIWGETFSAEENRKVRDNEEKAWIQATSAYAFTVGTMDWFGSVRMDGRRPPKKLKQLRTWWSGLIETWIATKKPMTDNIAKAILDKIKWLESDEGLEVLHEIVAEAEHDAEYREGLGDHAAGELLWRLCVFKGDGGKFSAGGCTANGVRFVRGIPAARGVRIVSEGSPR